MDAFSWHDALRACLPCVVHKHNGQDDDDDQQNQPRSRTSLSARAELERLLETDDEAETLSMHSNVGAPRRGRNKKKANKKGKKTVTLFGYNLFGRTTGPIALPDDDDNGDNDSSGRSWRRRSSSTLDSDAAPVQDEAIARLAQAQAQQDAERDERRAARRHRKELKRAAAALAAGVGEDEFEGFPGSGAYAAASGEFGPFVQAPPQPQPQAHPQMHVQQPSDEDAADFGAEMYTRPAARSSGSRSGSDSRSASSGGRKKSKSSNSTSASTHSLRSPPPPDLTHVDVASPSPPPRLYSPHTVPLPRSPVEPAPKTTAFVSTGFGGSRPTAGRGLSAAGFNAVLGRSGNDD